MVPKKGKNSRLSMVAKKPTFLILKMVNKSKKIKKLPGLTYHFCLLQVSEKVNSLEVNEQKDVAKLLKWTIGTCFLGTTSRCTVYNLSVLCFGHKSEGNLF